MKKLSECGGINTFGMVCDMQIHIWFINNHQPGPVLYGSNRARLVLDKVRMPTHPHDGSVLLGNAGNPFLTDQSSNECGR